MSLTAHPLLLECVAGPLDGDSVEAWPELGLVPAWAQRLPAWPVHELEAYWGAWHAGQQEGYNEEAQRISAQLALTPPFEPFVQAEQPERAVGRYTPVWIPARGMVFLLYQPLIEPEPVTG